MCPRSIQGHATENRPTRLAQTAQVAADDSGSVSGWAPGEGPPDDGQTANGLDALLHQISDVKMDVTIDGVTAGWKDARVCGS